MAQVMKSKIGNFGFIKRAWDLFRNWEFEICLLFDACYLELKFSGSTWESSPQANPDFL